MNNLFDSCLYFKLNRILRQINQMADAAFSPYKISSSHAYLMILVAKQPKIGTVELSQNLNLKPSTITRLVDKLVAQGYLQRKKEGKRCEISCTAKGEQLAEKLTETWNAFQASMRAAVGDEVYEMVNSSLNTLEDKIG